MWKESIAMAVMGWLHHERRKRNKQVPEDRRKIDMPMTMREARESLSESIDKFAETTRFHRDSHQ